MDILVEFKYFIATLGLNIELKPLFILTYKFSM